MHDTDDARHVLRPETLTAQAFAPFGDVIEAGAQTRHFTINEGHAKRYHDLAHIDASGEGGWPLLSIFRARPRALPVELSRVERHVLGSQAFMPLVPIRFLVVVAPAGNAPRIEDLRCFLAAPGQGVNYARGTWHHPLLAIDEAADFLVIDRGGPDADADCEEHPIGRAWVEL